MARTEAMKQAQKKYYERNKANINKKQTQSRIKRHGNEEEYLKAERARHKKYYEMNRNYRDIDTLYTSFLFKIL